MDVGRIQKINTLALDLMKKGLAENREDAVIQAEKIYKSADGEENTDIHRIMREPQSSDRVGGSTSDELSPQRIKLILEQNTQFVVKKFKELQDQLAQMEREINYLKSRSFSNPVREATVSNIPRGGEDKPKEQAGGAKTQAPAHPRSGNYNEEDVSIEKFFYMGHK